MTTIVRCQSNDVACVCSNLGCEQCNMEHCAKICFGNDVSEIYRDLAIISQIFFYQFFYTFNNRLGSLKRSEIELSLTHV